MVMVTVGDLGSIGIISDVSPEQLPLSAWSSGQNIRFRENTVRKAKGWSEPVGTPTVAPYHVFPYRTATDSYWVYAGLGKVYVTDGTTHTDITKVATTYTATADKNWTSFVLGGIPILNNGVEVPQMWSPPQVSQLLTDLTAWPANAKCESLRGFKQFLIALNYTNGAGTPFPRVVKWSHGAGFNDVPSSWDESDDTKDAGEYELADTRGDVIDGLAFRDSFLIYKDDSIWGMNFIGGGNIFRFYQVSLQLGAFTKNSVAEWERGHFIFGTNDIVITDGQSIKSIIDKKSRARLFNSIDPTNYIRSFVVPNLIEKEMWACYPTTGNTFANEAMIWNWEDQTISFRALPPIAHATFGVVNPGGGNVWDEDPDTWDSDSSVWDQQTFNPTITRIMMAGNIDTKLYLGDDPASNTENGVAMNVLIERSGLFNESADRVKFCKAVYPKMTSTGPVNIFIGSQMALDEGISWEGPFSFNPQTDYKIDCEVSFRWMAFKVESGTDIDWSLTSYDLDIVELGRN